jgi:ferritin-like metal-binding protein YciE
MELLVDRLRRMLWVEERLHDEVLPLVLDRAHATDLQYGIERHILETKQHVLGVRTILNLLGEKQVAVEEPALYVAVGETDLELCELLARTEHFEIASYTFLRSLANAIGEEDIGVRLTEIIEQEKYALELVEKATAKILAETVTTALALDPAPGQRAGVRPWRSMIAPMRARSGGSSFASARTAPTSRK